MSSNNTCDFYVLNVTCLFKQIIIVPSHCVATSNLTSAAAVANFGGWETREGRLTISAKEQEGEGGYYPRIDAVAEERQRKISMDQSDECFLM